MSSFTPPIRRQDSIGLFFSFSPDYNQVCDVVFDILKIDHNEIIGFQQLSKEKYVLKFSKSFIFQTFCDEYDEKDVDIGNGKSVRIINFSRQYTYISIRYAPFDMGNDILERILGSYGRVYGIRLSRFAYGKAEGLLNGTRTARMELKRSIPSSLNIFGHNVVFYYNGQQKTCFKCGRGNHMAADCCYDSDDRINIYSSTDFPDIQRKRNDVHDEEEEGKNKNGQTVQEDIERVNQSTEILKELDADKTGNRNNKGKTKEIPSEDIQLVEEPSQVEIESTERNAEEGKLASSYPMDTTTGRHDSSTHSQEEEAMKISKTIVEVHRDENSGDKETGMFSQLSVNEEDKEVCGALDMPIEDDILENKITEINEETTDTEEESVSSQFSEAEMSNETPVSHESKEQWLVQVKKGGKLKIKKNRKSKMGTVKKRKLYK